MFFNYLLCQFTDPTYCGIFLSGFSIGTCIPPLRLCLRQLCYDSKLTEIILQIDASLCPPIAIRTIISSTYAGEAFSCLWINRAVQPELLAVEADHLLVNRELIF